MRNGLTRNRLLFFCLLWIASSSVYANTNTNNKLQHLTHQIQSEKSRLNHEIDQRSQLQHQLQTTEITIGQLSKQFKKTGQQLSGQHQKLTTLNQQQAFFANQLQQQQQTLAKQIRIAYFLGREQYLKLILNQENPDKISRFMTYLQYLNQDRIKQMQQFEATLNQIDNNKQQIQQATLTLSTLQQQEKDQRQQLTDKQQQRKTVLQNINHIIITSQQKLRILMANQRDLENVIIQLKNKQAEASLNTLPFQQLRGKLPWPTAGKIVHRFGEPIQHSQLRWDGDVIQAPEGQPVDAIAAGKVIFADWLTGQGLLIIIDHGNGYMTLYGHNNSLYKKVGDLVKPGELIATVGHSGGYVESGLYFSVRHDGTPLNPASWWKLG